MMSAQPYDFDVIIIGAGAAGLFCAGQAGQLGQRVLLLDHAEVLGEKIRISGGGRCNFTNLYSSPNHFLSKNPHFVKSALSQYTPRDFIALMERYQIPYHEKHRGQLFCDHSAKDIIAMLFKECQLGQVDLWHPVQVQNIAPQNGAWLVTISKNDQEIVCHAPAVVMATGGLPVPAIGATDFALRFAQALQIPIVPVRPALVPLSFTDEAQADLLELAGLSLPVVIRAGSQSHYGVCHFDEDLLLTHKGVSGPAVLQASSYWLEGETLEIEFISSPACDALFNDESLRLKQTETLLATVLPTRLAKYFAQQAGLAGRKWAEVGKKDRQRLSKLLCTYQVKPAGTLGWKKAEVMVGGVDTHALNSRTLMSKQYPGLYFIGECVDVTGHLGGHNFQWAWSSAYACANALPSPHAALNKPQN